MKMIATSCQSHDKFRKYYSTLKERKINLIRRHPKILNPATKIFCNYKKCLFKNINLKLVIQVLMSSGSLKADSPMIIGLSSTSFTFLNPSADG